jgi:hypothetical protein
METGLRLSPKKHKHCCSRLARACPCQTALISRRGRGYTPFIAIDGSLSSVASSGPTENQPKGPKLIVKIGLAGDVYVNLRSVSVPEMLEAVRQIKEKDGFVVYYREAAMQDSAPEAMDTFKRLVELKPAIQMGNMAQSKWGKLTWVEIEEAPVVSRFFLGRG